jgi:dUTP pyrophosphatase
MKPTYLNVYCKSPYATLPKHATEQSACFDICACIKQEKIAVYGAYGSTKKEVEPTNDLSFTLHPMQRVAIPTGLILDIPVGYSVRLHPRSGLALKNGITMTNCEGIIDSDYVDELKVILVNTGSEPFTIEHGDRICQAELIKTLDYQLVQCYTPPSQKSDRMGGFGSTGVSS